MREVQPQKTSKATPSDDGVRSRRGRPSKIPGAEARIGIPLEHYVMSAMAHGQTSRQIAAALRITMYTLRRALRKRGYRVQSDYKLVQITQPLRPGRGGGAR